MFSSRSTIILLFVLFIPFILKYLGEEPYPAVLLPTYAGTIKKTDYLIMPNTSLFAICKDGRWEEIDNKAFFDPIPLEHAATLLAANLGLEGKGILAETKKSTLFRKLELSQRNTSTAADLRQLKDWIKTRLATLGFSTGKLRIVLYENTIVIKPGVTINKEIKNEKTYLLN